MEPTYLQKVRLSFFSASAIRVRPGSDVAGMTIAHHEQFMHPAVSPHTPHEAVEGKPPASYGWMARPAAIATLVALLYFKVLTALAHDWWTFDAQSHGLLIPPLAFYIAWLRRDHLLAQPVLPDNRGIWLVLAACAMFFLGSIGAEFFLTRISFVVLLAGLTWTFWGRRRLRALAFPFVLLATMVPLPALLYNAMAAPLQLLASGIASRFAQAVGITLFQDGNVIQLAHISLGVAEACSGLHSLSALVIASLLLGYLHCVKLASRL